MGTERLLDIFSFNSDDAFIHSANTCFKENNEGGIEEDNGNETYEEEYSNLSVDAFLEWFR